MPSRVRSQWREKVNRLVSQSFEVTPCCSGPAPLIVEVSWGTGGHHALACSVKAPSCIRRCMTRTLVSVKAMEPMPSHPITTTDSTSGTAADTPVSKVKQPKSRGKGGQARRFMTRTRYPREVVEPSPKDGFEVTLVRRGLGQEAPGLLPEREQVGTGWRCSGHAPGGHAKACTTSLNAGWVTWSRTLPTYSSRTNWVSRLPNQAEPFSRT